jgi:hypothetical protein
MGKQALDQYSLLHFSIGTLAYFWSIPFWIGLLIHVLFEYIENTQTGIYYINKYIIDTGLFNWPGGKHVPDVMINTTFDNILFAVGWISAWGLDRMGHIYNWY